MTALLPLLWLLAADPAAKPAGPTKPAESAKPFPKSLEELFEEKGDDGKAFLGEKERAALGKFPEHTLDRIAQDVDEGRVAGAEHLQLLLALELNPQSADLVFSDGCLLCHSDPQQKKALRFSTDPKAAGTPEHLNLKDVLSDAHFRHGLSCAGCHGGKPTDTEMATEIEERWPAKDVRKTDRTWIPGFCGRCHSDPAFMRGFNPAMPTDQVAKYKGSKHGQLLLDKKDSKAAQCVSCHGIHGIRGPKSRLSHVHPQAIPETCGHCHANAEYMAGYKKEDGTPLPTNQVEQFKLSVHGKALFVKGDLGAPACNDCHGNHAAMPPAVSSVSQVCRTCHAMNGTLFDGSKHKKEFEKHGWPECEKCHGKHDIVKPNDEMLSTAEDAMCGSCHAEHSKDNPDCNESVKYFRSQLDDLSAKAKSFPARAEHLAERGLDTEPILASMSELDEALVQSRTRVHTFDKGGFDVGAKAGREVAVKIEGLLVEAKKEEKFRLNGLLIAIGFMSFVAVIMGLRIRELDRQRKREQGQNKKPS